MKHYLFVCLLLLALLPVALSNADDYSSCNACIKAGYGWDTENDECSSESANTSCPEDDEAIEVELDSATNPYAHLFENAMEKPSFDCHDSDTTTYIWQLVHGDRYDELERFLKHDPDAVRYRSGDCRGALWWAYEYDRPEMVTLLVAAGADETALDNSGNTPAMMSTKDEL